MLGSLFHRPQAIVGPIPTPNVVPSAFVKPFSELNNASSLPQRLKQRAQVVVVDLVHEREQPAKLTLRKTLTCEPREVVSGQVREQSSLELSIGHRLRDE